MMQATSKSPTLFFRASTSPARNKIPAHHGGIANELVGAKFEDKEAIDEGCNTESNIIQFYHSFRCSDISCTFFEEVICEDGEFWSEDGTNL
ncbi:uncharacterized protein EAF01_002781 [Botrytis porri]|uniref:Uncharacterized protein n=1 Tax=Botrytis porri TaxID=87229 RepID=A0A4Z1KCK8_9HELO|nr:uncharacterized protein EAF01_002781 [Botrytis porri]KAF7911274.1 hypothetical protein EAF01_002781 [Botrytis porri]TGO83903.1 hypothetical protein BPOR_0577g00050 [Botrytis porri]